MKVDSIMSKFFILLLFFTNIYAEEENFKRVPDGEITINKIHNENYEYVTVMAVGRSPNRGQNLVVRLKAENGSDFIFEFPCHSFTIHEYTLINVIESSVSAEGLWDHGKSPFTEISWNEKLCFKVTIWIPKDKTERQKLSQWVIFSIK